MTNNQRRTIQSGLQGVGGGRIGLVFAGSAGLQSFSNSSRAKAGEICRAGLQVRDVNKQKHMMLKLPVHTVTWVSTGLHSVSHDPAWRRVIREPADTARGRTSDAETVWCHVEPIEKKVNTREDRQVDMTLTYQTRRG